VPLFHRSTPLIRVERVVRSEISDQVGNTTPFLLARHYEEIDCGEKLGTPTSDHFVSAEQRSSEVA
jgi:hypothetical protein